jgi:hypothetical protein
MYQNFIVPYLYEAQHVPGDTLPIIRSLKLHWQPLVFYTWTVLGRVVGGRYQARCAWQRPPTTRPTTFHIWKTRGYQCSFKLLMMGDMSPGTCWASYKYGIIKFVRHSVPENVRQLHVQQPSTYKKPEAASFVLGSWWWACCRPEHVELHINTE